MKSELKMPPPGTSLESPRSVRHIQSLLCWEVSILALKKQNRLATPQNIYIWFIILIINGSQIRAELLLRAAAPASHVWSREITQGRARNFRNGMQQPKQKLRERAGLDVAGRTGLASCCPCERALTRPGPQSRQESRPLRPASKGTDTSHSIFSQDDLPGLYTSLPVLRTQCVTVWDYNLVYLGSGVSSPIY